MSPLSFSSPETALLLVSTKNRDLWPSPTPEVRDSRPSCHSARVNFDKSDWFWSHSIVFTKPFKNGMSLDQARGRDSWCSNTGSPRFTDFPLLCACSESSLTNLIGSGLNLLCLLSHSKTECRWTRPEVAILGADQKEHGLWGREWPC